MFFLCEQSLTVSKSEAYTSTADQMEQQASGGNMIRRAAFGGLGLLGLYLTFQVPRGEWKASRGLCAGLGLYLSWCLLSIVWSESSMMTLRRVAVLLCYALGAIGVAKSLTLSEILKIVIVVSGTTLAIGFACEVLLGTFRPWASDYRFAGTLHPNTQGLYLTTLCLSAFCLLKQGENRKWLLPILGIGLLFLMLTKSRTSCAGMIFSLCTLWALQSSRGTRVRSFIGCAWLISLGLMILLMGQVDVWGRLSNAALMGREEQAESLTGRLPIWETLSPYAHRQPLFGYGYESFWVPSRINEVSSQLHWGIREAHSAYLDTILSVGILGGVLLFFVILLSLKHSAKRFSQTKDYGYAFIFGLLLFGLINAFTESGMIMPMFVPFIALVGIVHLACFRLNLNPGNNRPASSGLANLRCL